MNTLDTSIEIQFTFSFIIEIIMKTKGRNSKNKI